MTGTGTQNDPYIVDNTADFLEAITQSGVYVQLGSDIDVAADGYEYIGSVTAAALSVNGNGFAIRNATFQPDNTGRCFTLNDSHNAWQDISFLDCAVRPSTTSVVFIVGSNMNGFTGMKLSLQVQPLSNFTLFSHAGVSNCAADITMNGGAIIISYYVGSLYNSTFFIRGSYSFDKIIQGYSGYGNKPVQNVGIVFDGSLPSGTTQHIGNYAAFVGCYFALADSASIGSQGLSISLGQYSTSGQNVVFSVGSDVFDSVYTPSAFPKLTTAQMQDETYLQSIGWLP